MLIRSTPHACFVILRNGLTLELFYDRAFTGARDDEMRTSAHETATPSQGVWLMGESVLVEVHAGQA
ncbi:MAG TPA: hypothetical protein VGI70_01585 [Polyangiales bacterium]|jgi:hypothetical protein